MIREDDLRWIRDWGFDYIRLPMDYWLWVDSDWRKTGKFQPDEVFKIKEGMLEKDRRPLWRMRMLQQDAISRLYGVVPVAMLQQY